MGKVIKNGEEKNFLLSEAELRALVNILNGGEGTIVDGVIVEVITEIVPEGVAEIEPDPVEDGPEAWVVAEELIDTEDFPYSRELQDMVIRLYVNGTDWDSIYLATQLGPVEVAEILVFNQVELSRNTGHRGPRTGLPEGIMTLEQLATIDEFLADKAMLEQYRRLLVLYLGTDKTQAQIAEAVGLPVNVVKSIITGYRKAQRARQ